MKIIINNDNDINNNNNNNNNNNKMTHNYISFSSLKFKALFPFRQFVGCL